MSWMLLHRLADDGLLDLDAPVSSVLDRPTIPGVTFRQLTMHVSGLKHWDDTGFPEAAFPSLCSWFGYDAMMDHLEADGSALLTDFAGAPYHYSNYGPLIAGQAAATVVGDGATARSLARTLLFDPAGMENTTFQAYEPRPERLTTGYWADGAPHTWAADYADARALSSGAGGLIYTDACDLLRYARSLFVGDTALSPEAREDLFSQTATITAVAADGSVDEIGSTASGLATYPDFADEPVAGLWGHFGSGQHGHSSAFMVDPDTGAVFVVLANVAPDPLDKDPFTGERRYGAGYTAPVYTIGHLRGLDVD